MQTQIEIADTMQVHNGVLQTFVNVLNLISQFFQIAIAIKVDCFYSSS